MKTTNAGIGARIKAIRESKAMTLVQLQKTTGIDNGTLSKIENGKQGLTVEKMQQLASALGVEVGEFFTPQKKGVASVQNPEKNSQKLRGVAQNSASGAVSSSLENSPLHCVPVTQFDLTTDIPWDQNVSLGTLLARPDAAHGGVIFDVQASAGVLFQGSLIRNIDAKPAALAAHTVANDMMKPRLHPGDSVVIDLNDTTVPPEGGVFAVVLNGETIELRRLIPYINNGLRIRCDNPDYPEITLSATQASAISIAGRVKGMQGTGGF